MRKFLVSADPIYRVSRTWNNVHVLSVSLWKEAYQPPSSAAAASWASFMLASSKPFSDMAMASASHSCQNRSSCEVAKQQSGRAKVKKEKGLTDGRRR
jgi:hypothetical protein